MYLCQNAKTGEEQIFGARASERDNPEIKAFI